MRRPLRIVSRVRGFVAQTVHVPIYLQYLDPIVLKKGKGLGRNYASYTYIDRSSCCVPGFSGWFLLYITNLDRSAFGAFQDLFGQVSGGGGGGVASRPVIY